MCKADYSKHFLMDTSTVVQYVKDKVSYFDDDADLTASEIGDGNINYVFKVVDRKHIKSLVIKQADIFLRSSGRPLDIHRNKIEAEILKIEGRLAPGFTPRIVNYNENMCALAMEDISAYKSLRKEMAHGKIFPRLASDITEFLTDALLPTTELVLGGVEKRKRAALFTNTELCNITEDLVLTEPYYNYKNRNVITKGEETFVEEKLYSNDHLKAQVGLLRDSYMDNAQALLHGDLHSGSIFINETGIKVIDPEFAFYGPIGYDAGNVIGNLFFAWANKLITEPEDVRFLQWIEETVGNTYDLLRRKLGHKFDEIVSLPLYNAEFKNDYIAGIMSDTVGYAGTEMIRRTVGDTKVQEIASVKESIKRIQLDKIIIETGIRFIENRKMISDGNQLTEVFKEVANQVMK